MRNVTNPKKIKSDKINVKEQYENSKCPEEKKLLEKEYSELCMDRKILNFNKIKYKIRNKRKKVGRNLNNNFNIENKNTNKLIIKNW